MTGGWRFGDYEPRRSLVLFRTPANMILRKSPGKSPETLPWEKNKRIGNCQKLPILFLCLMYKKPFLRTVIPACFRLSENFLFTSKSRRLQDKNLQMIFFEPQRLRGRHNVIVFGQSAFGGNPFPNMILRRVPENYRRLFRGRKYYFHHNETILHQLIQPDQSLLLN